MTGGPVEALAAEQAELDHLLAGLTEADWGADSLCEGWSVADVVLHLAQTEEAVVATLGLDPSRVPTDWAAHGDTVESAMGALVDAQRAPGSEVLARWRSAAAASSAAFAAADPDRRVQWVTNAFKPATLATTRVAEHWTHGHDISDALGLPYADTERLRHVAWLAHSTLPYSFAAHGEEPVPVRCELLAPDGSTWRLGPERAPVVITGSAVDFCRVGAQRLPLMEADLGATGAAADRVLARLRNFAI